MGSLLKSAITGLVALGVLQGLVTGLDGLSDEIAPADVIVVLGNKVEENGQPSDRLAARLGRTLELYRQGWANTILVSGGVDPRGQDEAKVMKAYLLERGVPAGRIISDNRGVNTWQSAVNSRHLAEEYGWRKVLVVSQFFHIPRAKSVLQKKGFREVYSAAPRWYEARDVYALGREVVAFYKYLFY